jgi:hypothetical protein
MGSRYDLDIFFGGGNKTMEVNLQFHCLAALFPVKEHPVDIRYEAGWVPDTI